MKLISLNEIVQTISALLIAGDFAVATALMSQLAGLIAPPIDDYTICVLSKPEVAVIESIRSVKAQASAPESSSSSSQGEEEPETT